ncbi:hypothetical protein [Streptomyces sp. NBC_00075]|uniref:hypothetical protein n=1 Tax=Streptomyces TaxID=1883 RepID=UPI00386C076D
MGPGVQDAQSGAATLRLAEGVRSHVRVGVVGQARPHSAAVPARVITAYDRQRTGRVHGRTPAHRTEQRTGRARPVRGRRRQ